MKEWLWSLKYVWFYLTPFEILESNLRVAWWILTCVDNIHEWWIASIICTIGRKIIDVSLSLTIEFSNNLTTWKINLTISVGQFVSGNKSISRSNWIKSKDIYNWSNHYSFGIWPLSWNVWYIFYIYIRIIPWKI